MSPLDLTKGPPRSARAQLGGITFLARTVDKLRAAQHGGELGVYTISGVSEQMFERLALDEDAVAAAVESAHSDDDVAAAVIGMTTPERIAEWNAFIAVRQVWSGNREKAIETYPYIADRPGVPLVIDMLDEDDQRTFS